MVAGGLDRGVDALLRAIAEPRRREILSLVASEELSAGRIAEHFEITRPAVSQHLTVLKDAGLVTERREGTRRLYRASDKALAQLRTFMEGLWRQSLGLALSEVREDGGDADVHVAG